MAGAAALLEINYRLSTQPEAGPSMKLFGIVVDTSSPWPWLVAALLAVGGFLLFRATWPMIAAARQRALDEALAARRVAEGGPRVTGATP